MMLSPRMLSVLLSLTATISAISAVDPIKYVQCPDSTIANTPVVLQGKRFYDSDTGDYFPVKGIAYYPRPNEGDLSSYSSSVDFFTEEFRSLWESDIQYLKQLGVNAVRIYAVNPSLNHDAFMCELQRAGIYAIIGLLADCEGCAIGPDEAPSCYPLGLKTRGQWIINEFSKYANTLAFSAGNEVTLYAREWGEVSINAGCQKKFLRDMCQYVESCSGFLNSILPRKVPIGMVNWDYERDLQSLYFNCRTNSSDVLETPEWYGLNSYQHCDPNDGLQGWVQLRQDFESYNLPVPIVVAEYGCRERGFPTMDGFEGQRTWQQVDALYDSTYSEVFAGGVVFEYSAEKRIVDESSQGNEWPYNGFMKLQYGVGYYSPVDCDHTTTLCSYNPYPEFDGLTERLAAVDVSFVPNMADDTAQKGQVPQCPVDMPILSDFEWPSEEEDDLPCYTIATLPPTASPTTATPTMTFAPATGQPTTESPSSPGETITPTTGEPTSSPTQSPSSPGETITPTGEPTTSPTQSPSSPGETITPTEQSSSTPPSDVPTSTDDDEKEDESGGDDGLPPPTSGGVIPGFSSATSLSLLPAVLATIAVLGLPVGC